MALQSRFSFVGTIMLPKEKADSKRPFCKTIEKTDAKTKRKKKMLSMSFGVKEGDSNMAFVEVFDSEQETIMTMDTDNEKIEVDWEDRFDEDVIEQVAGYRKYTADLGDDFGGRQEFISGYDFILHLKEWLPKYKGKVMVTGQFVREYYAKNKQYYNKFKVRNVFAVDEDKKNRLSLTLDLFYNKDSIDKADFEESNKIMLSCWIEQYINKDEGKKYVPIQLVFSTAKYDLEENERHKKLFKYKMNYIEVKDKTMVHIPWEVVLVRGAEEAEFDESMLTDAQKEQIELGIKTLDDFKPKGAIFGDKVDEFRLFDPKLEGDYTEGFIDTELSFSEFEESIFVPAEDETIDEAKEKSKKKSDSKKSAKKDSSKKDKDDDEPPFEPDENENDGVEDDDLF